LEGRLLGGPVRAHEGGCDYLRLKDRIGRPDCLTESADSLLLLQMRLSGVRNLAQSLLKGGIS
jgi:hypothetical protein